MSSRTVLVAASALTLLSCSFVKIGSLHKQVRAPIAPFAVKSAPFELLTSRRAFRSLISRYPTPGTDECANALETLVLGCDVSSPCSFDALETVLRAHCGTTLAAGASDPDGPRLQSWIVAMIGSALGREGSADPHEGTFTYDLSAYLATPLDFDSLDGSVRHLVGAVPVHLELRRVYATSQDLLGREAAVVANLVAMPELRAVTVSELDLRTTRPDEPGLATTNAMLMDATRLEDCVPDQPLFGGLVEMKVRVASLVPAGSPLIAPVGSATSSDGQVIVEATLPPGETNVCAIVATSRAAVNVAPYLRSNSREIEVRIELDTPLPVAPSGSCGTGCDTTLAYVGGFAWIDVAFSGLDARALADVVSAFHSSPGTSYDAGSD